MLVLIIKYVLERREMHLPGQNFCYDKTTVVQFLGSKKLQLMEMRLFAGVNGGRAAFKKETNIWSVSL